MQRGHELEQTARDLYELETFETVSNPGIFISGDYATSPDGLVGESGQIEIKSVKFNTHFDRLRKGGIDTKYQWQIQGNLMLSGREWLDFISYCPDFPQDKQLYVFRVYPDVNQIEMLKERLEQFNQLVKSNLELL